MKRIVLLLALISVSCAGADLDRTDERSTTVTTQPPTTQTTLVDSEGWTDLGNGIEVYELERNGYLCVVASHRNVGGVAVDCEWEAE